MPNYVITSKSSNPGFAVRVANCTADHAESVRAQLVGEPVAPDDLIVTEVEHLYDVPPRRPWYRRFF